MQKWSLADPGIEIFRVLIAKIAKNENSEITEIYQNPQNTEIGEYNFKNSWNIVQMTLFSKRFCHHANHVPYFCLSRDSDLYRFIKLSLFLFFLFISVSEKQIEKQIQIENWKTDPHAFELYRSKNKDFPWFLGFCFKKLTNLGY